jgi:hypothetical protein
VTGRPSASSAEDELRRSHRPAPPRAGAGRWLLLSAVATSGVLGATAVLGSPLPAFKDGPPARVTGGFGEDSCYACHFDGEPNPEPGRLSIEGVPGRFEPGVAYTLRVTLSHPGMAVGGFQLAARYVESGEQAGTVEAGEDEEGRVGVLSDRGIDYIHHLLGGTEPTAPDTAHWSVVWRAPASGGEVVFHAAGLAGDGDESQIGDHVFTTEVRTAAP